MTNKLGFTALAAAAFSLSGCVVQPVEGSYVQQSPAPTYQPAPQIQVLQVEGPWQLRERGRVVRRIDVQRSRGGILIDTPRGRDFARRVGPGVFEDDRGRLYQFNTDVRGRFENPRNGRVLRMRRP